LRIGLRHSFTRWQPGSWESPVPHGHRDARAAPVTVSVPMGSYSLSVVTLRS
jgi:hypothetical protein